MTTFQNIGRRPSMRPALALLAVFGAAGAASAQSPIATSGYNEGIVYNGSNSGQLTNFDTNSAYVFDTQSAAAYKGLPDSGSFTSATGSGATYQLQPYTGNDALVLDPTGITFGTLSFTSAGYYSQLTILATSGNGGGNGARTIFYQDGSSATFTYSAPDWGGSGAPKAISVERYSTYDGGTQYYGGFSIFETMLTVDPTKPITGLKFTTPSGNTPQKTAIFAVSGIAALAPAPEPSQTAALGLGVLGLASLILRARRRIPP